MAQIISYLFQNSGLNGRKQEKTTRSFRYDLNQIPYDYTVKATNTYKGLDLIVYLSNYGRGPHEVLTKTIPKKKKNESLRNP